MWLVYDLAYFLALLVAWPWLVYRRWTRGNSGTPLREYFGQIPPRPVAARCVWIHAVSLGEINATRTLVAELRQRAPEVIVALSSTTATGLAQARRLYPQLVTFRLPLDFSFAIRTLMQRLRPSAIVLMELEVWPNLIEVATQEEVPVVIANGRITAERSMRRFRWPVLRWVARRMFTRLAWVGAQDQTYQARFVELGVPADRVEVTGSVKYDGAAVADQIEGQEELQAAMGIDPQRPLWVCGSTGPGEEDEILAAYTKLLEHFPALQLAIIPRKPERFDEVADLIVTRGYACLRRSTGAPRVPPGVAEPVPVFLGDTMGELRKFYALATVVFVGRSLVPLGGSDVMEVAGLGKPLVIGPYTDNFAEAVNLLLADGGCRRLTGPAALAPAITDLLRHPERRERMGAAGRKAILGRRGATARTVDRLLSLLS
ncbi:MAG: 3-deoxy-D-manno-octulosonic acid transferase [Phycisphaerales bacterium]|nr:3-deoxy-D-manno-octulosonic acid transferase [Phycisphaerales bacterium]